MIDLLLAGLVGGVTIAGGLLALDTLIRRPHVAALLTVITSVVTAAFEVSYYAFSIAGMDVRLADVVFTIIAAAAVARLLRLQRLTLPVRSLSLIGILGAFSLALGTATYGLLPAATEFRSFLYFFGGALYFVTIPVSHELLRRLARIYVIAAFAMVCLVLIRWAGVFVGTNIGALAWDYKIPIRVVSGPQTFFISQAVFLFIPFVVHGISARLQRLTGATLLVVVVLLNRRTVYLALLLGLVFVVYAERRLLKRALQLATVVAAAAVALLLLGPTEAPTVDAIASAPTDTDTLFVYRVESWTALLLDDGPERIEEWLVGQPLGAGYSRTIRDNVETESNPHSFYVQTLLRLGAVGVASLVVAYAFALRRLLCASRYSDTDSTTALTLFVMLAAQAVWFVAWPPGPEQGLITGVAMAYAARPQYAQGSHWELPRQNVYEYE